MKLPNYAAAEVAEEKVTGYLLNSLHPDGAPKAAFFTILGFMAENGSILANALKELAAVSEVTNTIPSARGTKYIVDGMLATPSGRMVSVRTVWIVDLGADAPRLVTAYPQASGDT